jgi:hypothetical protein
MSLPDREADENVVFTGENGPPHPCVSARTACQRINGIGLVPHGIFEAERLAHVMMERQPVLPDKKRR